MEKESLLNQLREDVQALAELLIREDILPPSHVRILASGILRKWLVEGLIHKLSALTKSQYTFKTYDTKTLIEAIDNNEKITFFMTGGINLDGIPLRGIYASDSPSNINNKPEIPIDSMSRELLKSNQLLNSKRIYYNENWFDTEQIIKFCANKYGGVHFDNKRNSEWQTKIEEASNYLIVGNPDGFLKRQLIEPYSKKHQILIVFPKEKGQIWNCLDIELLSAAQAFINLHVDGKPYI